MPSEDWIRQELEGLQQRSLFRHTATYPHAGGKFVEGTRTVLNFSSNDYLNLSRDERLLDAANRALREMGSGTGASRLMTGSFPLHELLEAEIAQFKTRPAAILFGSGYLANTGTIPTLVGRNDHVFADRLVHASIVDGIGLSRAQHHRFRHNDMGHLEALLGKCTGPGRKLIVTESVFSMDGDTAPLRQLVELANQSDSMLMIDEAHATGIFGPAGAGLASALGIESQVSVSLGTLSKSLGSYGGFVAGSETLRDWLVNRARSFIYSTALPAATLAASREALCIVQQEKDLGEQILQRAHFFRQHLNAAGLETGASASQIVPVLVGEASHALELARRLMDRGILAVPIRPPTVPVGTARLRLSLTLAHTEDDLAHAARVVANEVHRLVKSNVPLS